MNKGFKEIKLPSWIHHPTNQSHQPLSPSCMSALLQIPVVGKPKSLRSQKERHQKNGRKQAPWMICRTSFMIHDTILITCLS